MYETYYGFTASPFQLTPDARFFYGSRAHSRAIAHLIFGLSQGEGFVIVTGEVGAGKTTLVERLWSQLHQESYTLVRIKTTKLSGDDLLRLSVVGFGVEPRGTDKASVLLGFEEAMRQQREAGRRCLLVVDEAQNLSLAALEELRMLSNIGEDRGAALQTILLGQPQFRRLLANPRPRSAPPARARILSSGAVGCGRDAGLCRASSGHGGLDGCAADRSRGVCRIATATAGASRVGSTGSVRAC